MLANTARWLKPALGEKDLEPAKLNQNHQNLENQVLSVFLAELKGRLQMSEESVYGPAENLWLQAAAWGPRLSNMERRGPAEGAGWASSCPPAC